MRGFQPRRPSPKVRDGLFVSASAGPPLLMSPGAASWLAPVAAVGLLLLSLVPMWNPMTGDGTLTPLRLGAPELANLDPIAVGIERNLLPAASFRSTNAGGFSGIAGSLLLERTNGLNH